MVNAKTERLIKAQIEVNIKRMELLEANLARLHKHNESLWDKLAGTNKGVVHISNEVRAADAKRVHRVE